MPSLCLFLVFSYLLKYFLLFTKISRLLAEISVCFPCSALDKSCKCLAAALYPFGKLATDILLCFALTDVFKQCRATECGSAEIKKVFATDKIGSTLTYSAVLDYYVTRNAAIEAKFTHTQNYGKNFNESLLKLKYNF